VFVSHQIFRAQGPSRATTAWAAAGIAVPRVTFPSLEKGSGLMTKADFGDFTYVTAALDFLGAMVFIAFIIGWWQRKE
jgi:hypothetical protein